MIARNARGDVLVEFIHGAEHQLLTADVYYPLTHALMLAEKEGKYLFMLNRWKRRWEVPGGLIETGESARVCAIRELHEETGRTVTEARFVGIMKFRLQPDSRVEYGALYAGELVESEGPGSSQEAERILLWDLEAHIGVVDEIDRTLVQFFVPPAPRASETEVRGSRICDTGSVGA